MRNALVNASSDFGRVSSVSWICMCVTNSDYGVSNGKLQLSLLGIADR